MKVIDDLIFFSKDGTFGNAREIVVLKYEDFTPDFWVNIKQNKNKAYDLVVNQSKLNGINFEHFGSKIAPDHYFITRSSQSCKIYISKNGNIGNGSNLILANASKLSHFFFNKNLEVDSKSRYLWAAQFLEQSKNPTVQLCL